MDEPKQAEVVTIKEAIEKVKKWIEEKNFEKAKQGCEEILAVEKDNAEIKALLEKANQGLGVKAETPSTAPTAPVAPAPEIKKEETTNKVSEIMPKPTKEIAQTPNMIMKPKENKPEEVKPELKPKDETKPVKIKKHFPLVKVILIIILLGIIGGLILAFLQGWLNPAFDWILGLLGL